MQAIVLSAPGGAEQLSLQSLPVPKPKAGEVLLQVYSAGVNRPDIAQRQGLYPPPTSASPLLGLEVAGVVVACGEGVCDSHLGRSMMALCNGGGYAEYVCVPAAHLMSIPQGLTFSEAASLPEVYMTVWQNLILNARLSSKQRVLIHGGSGGVGSAAIQLCKRHGATVLTTVSSQPKAEYCRALGADAVFVYNQEDWVDGVKQFTQQQGVNILLDMVAGEYLNRNLSCMAPFGFLLVIAMQGGRLAEIDVAKLLMKQICVRGSTLRSQSNDFKATLAAEVGFDLQQGFAQGHYRSCVQEEFPLACVAQAHQLMESGGVMGKVVLKIKD